MPNHVDNDLRISGNLEVIKEFFEFAKGEMGTLDANKFIPYPDDFKKQDKIAEEARKKDPKEGYKVKDGYNSGGYEWCIANWGTKWGIYDCSEIKWFKKSAFINCQSAWSPPTKIVLAMSKKFPNLVFTLKYFEGGMGFKGMYQVKDGEVLVDQSERYRGGRGG